MLITEVHVACLINMLIQVVGDSPSVDNHLVSFGDLNVYGPEAIIDFLY